MIVEATAAAVAAEWINQNQGALVEAMPISTGIYIVATEQAYPSNGRFIVSLLVVSGKMGPIISRQDWCVVSGEDCLRELCNTNAGVLKYALASGTAAARGRLH